MPSRAFPPEVRLHYSWQYRAFFQGAFVLRLSQCTIFRIPNQQGLFRLGISIKSRGRSVDRNRVKRRIREQFRLLRSELGAFDYNVFIPAHKKMTPPYPRALFMCLEKELRQALLQPSRWSAPK